MKIAQEQHYEGDDWWKWSVWIEGSTTELDQVEKVVWRLHPTFPKPVREMTNRGDKFRLESGGWGTFRVVANVVTKNGKKETLHHELELSYPDGNPAKA